MPQSFLSFVRKWRASRNGGRQLVELLAHVEWQAPLGARNHWLIEVVRWVRRGGLPDDDIDQRITHPQHVRLRYLLRTLERQPEWKLGVARLLRATFRDSDAVSLLCDTGMPTRTGFWGALLERVQSALIHPAPNTPNLAAVVTLMFADAPDGTDRDEGHWIESLSPELLESFAALLRYRGEPPHLAQAPDREDKNDDPRIGHQFSSAMLSAMHTLCYQIGATGLSPAIRSRLEGTRIQSLPFYRLGPAMLAVEAAQSRCDDEEKILLDARSPQARDAPTVATDTAAPQRPRPRTRGKPGKRGHAAPASGSQSAACPARRVPWGDW